MSTSTWGYLFLLLGIFAAALLLFFGNISSKNEQNYYLLKETTQNAMLDSVDKVAYQVGLTQEEVDNIKTIDCASGQPGTIRIITERFVESFARRFSESVANNKNYKIQFYEINECPAKVSVKVTSTESYSWLRRLFRGKKSTQAEVEEANIVNQLTAILETKD